MKHFYENLHGWFNNGYPGAYEKIFTHFKTEPTHIVELGVWQGKSSAYLGVELFNHGWVNVKVDLIDHFNGSEEHQNSSIWDNSNIYDKTVNNLQPLKGKINYEIINLDSKNASLKYEDESLDFIFIDASHDYKSVKEDIELWYPKIKKGGIISGDDYCSDWKSVIQAVDEAFGKRVVFLENKHWWVEK
jgi:predicted O-methyltransferase YrrM